jgi:iron(III) transport system ATP-binding protein
MATEFIEIRDLVKRFPGSPRPAVGPLSLGVRKGELVAVLGPSGCGKTTLLRLIAGFERPDAGSIIIDGHLVADRSRWVEPEDRGVGMVFQDYALFPHLTVLENIAFGLGFRRVDARVRELLQRVGLMGFEDRYPHELSGGEQQRVALARSLATNPKVLLLDEPFSNLDADLRPKMRAELKILLKRLNCTTIFVTHDQEEAFELADRIAVLNGGRLEQIDTPQKIYREPATRFVAEFIGHADFLTGRVRGNCIETALGCFAKPPSVPEGAIVAVMIRPEEIELSPSSFSPSLPLTPTRPNSPAPFPEGERGAPLSVSGRGLPYGSEESRGAEREDWSKGLIVARCYRGGIQLITVRLPSGESVRSLQPAGAHFPLASRVRVHVKTDKPLIFGGEPTQPDVAPASDRGSRDQPHSPP